MDSAILNQLFRQLFRHPACQSVKSRPGSSLRRLNDPRHPGPGQQQRRSFLTRKPSNNHARRKNTDDGMFWTKRDDYPRDIDEQLRTFPLVTAKDLRHHRERPRQIKMLTREFIDG